MSDKYEVYKEHKGDKVWWVDKVGALGDYLFTFDKKKLYNLFRDYPDKLSVKEWLAFNDENEYWKDFFKERNLKYAVDHLKELDRLKRLDVVKDFE